MMDRRNFLKSTGIAFASVAVGAAGAQLQPQTTGSRPLRPLGVGRFLLELDGAVAGSLSSFEGGSAEGTVVTERAGPDQIQRKHLANVRYTDIVLQHGADMSPAYFNWLKSALDRRYERRSGAIIHVDFNGREIARTTFTRGLVTEIGFPALDASSKDQARMTVKIAPETARTAAGSGAAAKMPLPSKVAMWLPSNYRLRINGLDSASARVTRVDAITIKQKVAQDPVGEARDYAKEPAGIEFPNLAISCPENFAQELYQWHEDFVIKGNSGQAQERAGTLEFLSPTMKEAYFTLNFKNLGIFKLSPEKQEAGVDSIRRVRAEMYCEQLNFEHKALAA